MSEINERAAALRAAFDRGFAEAPARPRPVSIDYLAIRAGAQRRVVPLAEVSALHVDRKVTPLPSDHAALAGLAGVRGVLIPVYDLRVLLDANRPETPRWMLVTADAAAAFAFDGFEGLVRVAATSIVEGAAEIVSADGEHRVVLSLDELLTDIRRRLARRTQTET